MPELSQKTLGEVIKALGELQPAQDMTFPDMHEFWRTTLFTNGLPDWLISFVESKGCKWSLIIPALYRGGVLTKGHGVVGEYLCHQMLRDLTKLAFTNSKSSATRQAIRLSLQSDGFDQSESLKPVPAPRTAMSSAMVEAALNDAETLIRSAGPARALDRMHTAMHAYLEDICTSQHTVFEDEASVTQLFALIKKSHPLMQIGDRESREVMQRMFGGLSQVIEASNPVRNSKSMAHPNELLGKAEATLVLNAMRSLLNYLHDRLTTHP